MSRIFLSEISRANYFGTLKTKSGISWGEIAKKLNVSNRQLRDWRKGIYSLPHSSVKLIAENYGVNLPVNSVIKENYWHIKEAARRGGKRRYELHGSPGTVEGRKKGGLNSLKTHSRYNTGFIISKKI